MIRITHIIPRAEYFNWIENPDIIRVTASYAQNKSLRNRDLMKIEAFHNISPGNDPKHSINYILGMCEGSYLLTEYNDAERSFLAGLKSQRGYGYITLSQLKRLAEIETLHQAKGKNINFGFRQNKLVMDLLEKYGKNHD